MISNYSFRIAPLTGLAVLFLVAGAHAGQIVSYTTNAPGSEFVGGVNSDVLNSTSGQIATLTFTPDTTSNSGVPSAIDLGDFLLACATCTTSQDTIFGGFTFDLIITDTTDNATGEFIGTSYGGIVSSNSSTIRIYWTSPAGLQVGPGATYALSGNFNYTEFDMVSPITLIVAPNSGTPAGDTRIQGEVNSVPEPATVFMIAGPLIGIGAIRRRRSLAPCDAG